MSEVATKSSIINLEPMRPGQRGAVNKLWDNVRRGKQYTGIVLPTRYGKSDVIKAGGLGLMLDGLVSRAVILEPATILVSQILNKRKLEEAAGRYSLPYLLGGGISTYAVTRPPRTPFPPRDAHFVAMTVQMANYNRPFFVHWVKWEQDHKGVSPVFFIDEAHTGSPDNQWGQTAEALAEAGAFLVLLTATPNRTDQMPVAGFDYEPVREEQVTYQRNDERWSADKIVYRLLPDWETTFKDAWAEMPPALCFISRLPIDVEMNRVATLTGEIKGYPMLSSLLPSQVRPVLGHIVRDEQVVWDGCFQFIEALQSKRAASPAIAGIVFVGNDNFIGSDNEEDEETNRHARQVSAVLEEKAPWLKVVIATSTTDNNPQEEIEKFQDGKGDVLIVKQMGGIGLDVPRLKVCLDLSTFRTGLLFTQRLCRIATIYQPTPDPKDLVLSCTYISPDDVLSRRLFDEFVGSEGGDASMVVNPQYIEKVQDTLRQQALPDTFATTGNTAMGEMSDTELRSAPGEALSGVRKLLDIFPELSLRRTEPELANTLEKERIVLGPGNGTTQQHNPSPAVQVHDINAEQRAASGIVTQLAKRVAGRRMRGQNDDVSERLSFGDTIKAVYVTHKRKCGLPVNGSVEELDVEQLERLAVSLRGELNNG